MYSQKRPTIKSSETKEKNQIDKESKKLKILYSRLYQKSPIFFIIFLQNDILIKIKNIGKIIYQSILKKSPTHLEAEKSCHQEKTKNKILRIKRFNKKYKNISIRLKLTIFEEFLTFIYL